MKQVQRIETNRDKNLFWSITDLNYGACDNPMELIQLLPEITGQTMEGFGGAFTESSADSFDKLTEANKERFLEAYFGESGLGYSIGRVAINSCDFALENYAYVEEGDQNLDKFSIAHDEKQIIPLVRRAAECRGKEMRFLASPWSPPAYMKTNGEMNHGGSLKEEYRKLWADYFVRFIQEYRKAGVPICAVTVQNEPEAVQTWDSCIYTAKEEGSFVADYLGPAMEAAGLSDVKIFVWDHNKERLYQRYRDAVSVEGASKYIAGAAMHWYTGDHFESIEIVRKQYPDAQLIFSEGCVEYSRFADSDEIRKAEMYAHDMIGNFRAGVSAFLDWNLLLDEKGGPNHVGNFCAAPVMLSGNGDFELSLMYYYIGQLSRFVPEGSKLIATTRYTDQLDVCAFVTPEKERVLVVLNKSGEERRITVREELEGFEDTVCAHSIVTYRLPGEK